MRWSWSKNLQIVRKWNLCIQQNGPQPFETTHKPSEHRTATLLPNFQAREFKRSNSVQKLRSPDSAGVWLGFGTLWGFDVGFGRDWVVFRIWISLFCFLPRVHIDSVCCNVVVKLWKEQMKLWRNKRSYERNKWSYETNISIPFLGRALAELRR